MSVGHIIIWLTGEFECIVK